MIITHLFESSFFLPLFLIYKVLSCIILAFSLFKKKGLFLKNHYK